MEAEFSNNPTLAALAKAAMEAGYKLKYEVVESREVPGEWRAEAVGDDGECYVAIFSGPDAKDRAEEYADAEASFNLRWECDMRAIKMWQKETGKTLVWPSHDDLCVWLLNRLAKYEALDGT